MKKATSNISVNAFEAAKKIEQAGGPKLSGNNEVQLMSMFCIIKRDLKFPFTIQYDVPKHLCDICIYIIHTILKRYISISQNIIPHKL